MKLSLIYPTVINSIAFYGKFQMTNMKMCKYSTMVESFFAFHINISCFLNLFVKILYRLIRKKNLSFIIVECQNRQNSDTFLAKKVHNQIHMVIDIK